MTGLRLDHPENRQARILRAALDRPLGFARLFAATRRFGRGHPREDEKHRTHIAVSSLCRHRALTHGAAGFRTTPLGRAALADVDRRFAGDSAAAPETPAGRCAGDRSPALLPET